MSLRLMTCWLPARKSSRKKSRDRKSPEKGSHGLLDPRMLMLISRNCSRLLLEFCTNPRRSPKRNYSLELKKSFKISSTLMKIRNSMTARAIVELWNKFKCSDSLGFSLDPLMTRLGMLRDKYFKRRKVSLLRPIVSKLSD